MTIYLGPPLLTASVGLPGKVPASPAFRQAGRSRNGPFPLSLLTLFSLSSRRDCRVSPPVTFMTGTRLCGSNPLCTASDTEGGRYPLRCPMKLGLSSHSGWTGRFPSLVICARSSEKTFSKTCFLLKEQKSTSLSFCDISQHFKLFLREIPPTRSGKFFYNTLKTLASLDLIS